MRRLPLRSPPRVRGKVFFFTGASFCAIFFLEPSGNLLLEPSGSSWVPPDGSIFVFAIGSPPRMRGKVAAAVPALFLRGITPACAGKSEKQVPFLPPYQDHPRVCGEKKSRRCCTSIGLGSPPRVRGKAAFDTGHRQVEGITPAYAGKSSPGSAAGCHARDHPRVCGEKSKPKPGKDRRMESPPRVRGKAHDGRQVLRGLRRHLKCDWDGHLRLVQVGNVVHERALMPDVHESQSRRTPQRHNDRMGQPVQAGMHGGSHGCRGRAAAPKCLAHHPWLLPPCRMVIRPRP